MDLGSENTNNTMADNKKEQEREELHRIMWAIADEMQGSVDGYDKQGRLVLISTYISYPDGKEGHFIRCVNERGYWEGGAYDPIFNAHMSLPLEPFEEVNL